MKPMQFMAPFRQLQYKPPAKVQFTDLQMLPVSLKTFRGNFTIQGVGASGEAFSGPSVAGGSAMVTGSAARVGPREEFSFHISLNTLADNALLPRIKPEFLRIVRGNDFADVPLLMAGHPATESKLYGPTASVARGKLILGAAVDSVEYANVARSGPVSFVAAVKIDGARQWINLDGVPGKNFLAQ